MVWDKRKSADNSKEIDEGWNKRWTERSWTERKERKKRRQKEGNMVMSSEMKLNKASCPHQPHGAPELPGLCFYFTELICVTGFTSTGLTLALQKAADLPISSAGTVLAWCWWVKKLRLKRQRLAACIYAQKWHITLLLQLDTQPEGNDLQKISLLLYLVQQGA